MELKNFEELREKLGNVPKHTVSVACAHEESTLKALFKAKDEGLIDYVLTGNAKEIVSISDRLGHKIITDDIIDTKTDAEAAAVSVKLVHDGEADFVQKGVLHTAAILKAVVNKETGLGMGRIMNHVGIIQMPQFRKLVAFSDAGMIINPDLEKKKGIIENTVELFHALGYDDPKVACMCALEEVNPKMPETVEARALKEMNQQGIIKGCTIEGPISFDLALNPHTKDVKKFDSPVAGNADIVIAPDISAGNMTLKALYTCANAVMAGIILGAKCPVALTSRDSIPEGRYYSLLLCSGMLGK